jgi:MauM/NapG family ferredoxin protein
MRRAVQASSLFLFSGLFALANANPPDWMPVDIYLRLDPLLALTAMAAQREVSGRLLWSLVLVAATLLIGRFFCGWVCPLGAVLDFLDRPLFRAAQRRAPATDAGLRRLRLGLLAAIAAAAAAGLSLAYLLDPLALLTRVYAFVLTPLLVAALNLALDLARPIASRLGWAGLAYLSYPQPVFYMSVLTALLFAGILTLNRHAPRFWCRYLCPLGALLSLAAPLGMFKRRVDPACTACEQCAAACPMGAVLDGAGPVSPAECVQCRTCAEACPVDAVRFPAVPGASSAASAAGEHIPLRMSRRSFLYSAGGGLGLATLAEQSPLTALQGKRPLIRPPGALPEREFLRSCVRCGACMKACPTNTLQPCLWEAGLAGLWSPKLETRLAACDQHCAACGRVCPTQAIRSLPLDEKTHAKIGTAIIRKEQCLVWAQDKLCLVCDEVCPYNAIVFRTIEGYRRPVVVAARCNGCGYCEERCPVRGDSAIVIVADGEIRLPDGSYLAEATRLQLEFAPNPGDDQYILRESGLQVGGRPAGEPRPVAPSGPTPPGKPKGFL